MPNDTLYMTLELKDNLQKQIQADAKDLEKLSAIIRELNIDLEKITGDTMQKNLSKNIRDAERAMFKLLETKEKIDKAMSRNTSMRSDGFLGVNESELQKISARIDDIIEKVMNVGAKAYYSGNAVKDMLSSLSSDIVSKSGNAAARATESALNKQVKERAKSEKDVMRELAKEEKDAADAAARNAKNQDRVRDALSRIATARANLTAASERGNQQEIAHARLLISMLDRLSSKLNAMKEQFLGAKGVLDGVLGSGYKGLMRNVGTSIRDIGGVDGRIVQGAVNFDRSEDLEKTRNRIMEVRKAMEELGKSINNTIAKQTKSPEDNRLMAIREMQEGYQALRAELTRLTATYHQLQQAEKLGEKLGLGHIVGYTGPQKSLSDETWQTLKREQEAREVAAAAAEKHKKKLAELTDAFDKQAKAEEREREAQARSTAQQAAQYQARQKTAQATRRQAEELVKLRMELLKTQASELQNLMKNGKGILSTQQFNDVRNALRSVREEMRQLETVMQRMSSYSARDLMSFGRGTQNWSPLITHTQEALDASRAVSLLSDSERKFVESLSQASSGLRNQGVLLRDLQTLATQYLSLWGARSFLDKIIETGGLLEQQRLSISAILGSMDKANVVFGQIKNLAIKSPFGVVDLDKMSKQLTAYGFQYEELFDWTKRLADISAATGTEVSRLALALGHVRSEGALSGYTLRQFAMANVPMLQNLANNLGITAKEVREKTKKKEIGYEDVKKVLQDLTDEGGMFYNAQEVMSQALNAKFKNLRDAFDIMYGEIAESGVGDLLKEIAEALTAGAKEWQRFGTDILWVASAFGIVKTAMLSYRAGMAAISKELGVLSLNTKAFTAEQVQQMYIGGQLTRGQILQAVASGKLSVQQAKLAASSFHVTEVELEQIAATKRVSAAQLGNAIATSKMTMAELRYLAALRASYGIGGRYRGILTSLMMAFRGVGNAVRAAGAAIKSFLPFLAVGAIVDLFSRYSQQVSSAKEAATEAASAMSTGLGDIKTMYDSLSKKPPQGINAITASVENMKEALKDNGGNSNILKQVERTKDVNAQYEILYNHLKEIADGYTMVKYSIEGYIAAANNVGGGWFTDNMKKDINQYGDAVIKKEVAKGRAEQFATLYKKEIESFLKSEGRWVEETMRDAGWKELMDLPGVWEHFVQLPKYVDEKDVKLYTDAAKAAHEYGVAEKELAKAREEVDRQMPEYAEYVKLAMDSYSKIFKIDTRYMALWSDEDLRGYVDRLGEVLGSLNIPEEAKNHIRDGIIDTFPKDVQVKVRAVLSKDPKDVNALTGWHKDLQDYFDKHKIGVKLSADDSIQKVEKQLQEARKKAQEKMDSAGAILTYWKIKPDLFAVEKFTKEHPLLGSLIRGVFSNYKEGKDELDKIDQTHKDTGLSVNDDKKSKKSSSGSKADKELAEWRKRIQLLEKYRQELEKLSQYMSRSAAEAKLKADDNFSSLWLFGDPNDYEQYLRGAMAKLGTKGDRGSYVNELKAKIGEEDLRKFSKDADAATNELKKMLDMTQKNYDIYKKWFELTGDAELASRIANVAANGSYADVLRSKYGELGGAGGMTAEAFFGLSESEAKKYGEKSGLFTLWKEWEENVKSLREANLKLYEEAIKSSKDYDAQIDDINRDLEKHIAAINAFASSDDERSRLISEATRRAEDKKSQIRWERFRKSTNLELIADNAGMMPFDELKSMIKAMREIADTSHLNVREGRAWNDAMKKLTDQLANLDPLKAIQAGASMYEESRSRRESLETELGLYDKPAAELRRMGINKDDLRPYETVKEEYLRALTAEGNALKIVTRSVKTFANSLTQLGSAFQSIGSTIGGQTGDVLNGLGSIFNGIGNSMDALTNVQQGKGFGAMMSKVSAAATVISAVLEMNSQLSALLPTSEGTYEHYAEKAREVNKLREAVDDYALSVAKAKVEEDNWFGGGSLSKLRSMGEQARTTLENYYHELFEPQEIYKDKGSGLSRWGVPIAAGIAAIAGVAATAITGGAAGVAILGAMSTLESVVGTVAATAIGGAIVGGIGAAAGQIAQGVVNGITYGKGQTDARSNMRIQTRHSTWFRSEKTQGLEDWVREKLSLELFNDEGLVNLEAAEQVLDKYGDKLVGDTKETLERLVELRKEYDDFVKNLQEYIGDMGSSLQDSMVNALWDWLSDGEDAMDKFYDYASDTFRKLSQDIVKMFLKSAVFDMYSSRLEKLFEQWSLGGKSDSEFIQEMGVFASMIAGSFENALPMAQQLASVLDSTFGASGYDIKNSSDSGRTSSSNSIKSITEETADLLASYINAIRADVSVDRVNNQQILIAVQSLAQVPVIANAQLTELRQIASNTGATAENTAAIGEIFELLRGNTLGVNSFSIK